LVLPSFDVLARAALETLRISVPTIVQAAQGSLTTQICDERLDSWSRNLVEQAGIRLDVRGTENLVYGEPFVVVSNHQSHYDIPVLFQALRIPLRMVAKKEIFRIPFMAGAMRAAGFVEIDRKDPASAIRTLKVAHSQLGDAVSLWIAPEGTRSKTGHLGRFKKGGFHLAMEADMRILPVAIDGTRFALPAGGINVTRGATAYVTILPPVDPAAYGPDRMRQLIATVRASICDALPPSVRD
jgi:1-acyl-sn-glycerol-3-phosphate acyltransferase